MSDLELAIDPPCASEASPPKPAPQRSPARLARGGATALVGVGGAFLVMAHDGQLRLGVPLGALFVAIAALGVMDLLGTFDDAPEHRAGSVTLRTLAWPLLRALATIVLFVFALGGAAHGVLGQALGGALVTVSFLTAVASVFALGVALGPWRDGRPLWRRHGFWLLVACALLYLPALGNASLWDPWETHYGEVSREILARDDWISTWWGWQGWFFSKPVLGFWMQAIAMATVGVHHEPGRMLEGLGGAAAHPEWAVRAPTALIAMLGVYVLYKGVAKAFGPRAGLLGGIALATTPQWFFLAHQTMTDMPFVASMSAAMGLLLLGLQTSEHARVRVHEVTLGRRALRFSAWHLVFGALLAVALPQIIYLVTRNVELVLHASGAHGFRLHGDELHAGSAGNCGVPGNPPCGTRAPASHFEPALQALVWALALGGLLYANRGERRLKRILYLGAWLFAALATMAKGPAGVGLPVLCVLAYVCATRRWRELPQFEIGSGSLIVAALALPWFVAMVVRHGAPFTDELIFHDMYDRAFDHVHDTNDGVDTSFRYYVQQLGYALFPWSGFAPLGLVYWMRDRARGNDASIFLMMWAVIAFALFALMGTKFHHYIFPAVPPLAMLVGVAVDGMLGRARSDSASPTPHARMMIGAAALGGGLLTALVARDLADEPVRLLQLFTYQYKRPMPATLDLHTPIVVFGALAVGLAALMAIAPLRRWAALAFVLVALAWGAWGLDVYMPRTAPHWGQREVLARYFKERAGPEEPLVAYLLNWKGENFYSGNRIAQFTQGGAAFTDWVRAERERGTRTIYVVTEQAHVGGLRAQAFSKGLSEVTTRADSNQFILVRAEL